MSHDLAYLRWLDVYGQLSQTFQVQACEEAMILLAEDFGIISDSWYHVYLGTVSNTRSYIIVCVILQLNLKLNKNPFQYKGGLCLGEGGSQSRGDSV